MVGRKKETKKRPVWGIPKADVQLHWDPSQEPWSWAAQVTVSAGVLGRSGVDAWFG